MKNIFCRFTQGLLFLITLSLFSCVSPQNKEVKERAPSQVNDTDPSCWQMYEQGLSRCGGGESEDGRDQVICEAQLKVDLKICCGVDASCLVKKDSPEKKSDE